MRSLRVSLREGLICVYPPLNSGMEPCHYPFSIILVDIVQEGKGKGAGFLVVGVPIGPYGFVEAQNLDFVKEEIDDGLVRALFFF